MKIMKYISLILAVVLTVSCEKHEIMYDAEPVGDMAEFQLHYYVPVTAVAANNITKVEVNSKLFANNKAPLATYNVIPSGAVGRFYAVNPGPVQIKMYQGTDMATLVYDKTVTLVSGKQNVVVHDFAQVPKVFNNGFPYEAVLTTLTDSTAWIKFYNFLYESAGVPTTKKLQYQYVNTRTSALMNIGTPVGFGESTGWEKIVVVKTDLISQGARTLTFKIKEVDGSGVVIGDLQIMGTTGVYAAYTATSSLTIGRRYHHTMAGFRAVASPNSAVRVFTAL
jgi:hypothetical protein